MKFFNRLPSILALALSVLATGTLHAAERGLVFTPHGIGPGGNTTVSQSSLNLVATGISGATLNLILPADYKTNTRVVVRVFLSAATAAVCRVKLKLAAVTRSRNGRISVQTLAGAAPTNGTETATLSPSKVAIKSFDVDRVGSGDFVNMFAGDLTVLRFDREADDVLDTCTSTAFLLGMEVRYQDNTP